jgi:hypothetical protein
MQSPNTTRTEVQRRQTKAQYALIATFLVLTVGLRTFWPRVNSWYVVGALCASFLIADTWYLRASRCLNCRKPLGGAAAASFDYLPGKTINNCPHCGVSFDEPIPEKAA